MKRKSLAIPIRCVDFSNSSQVVGLYTLEHGLVDAIAKGAHREKNPFQGPFDLVVLYEAVFLERRSAGLSILTEASVLEGFRGLRTEWHRHVAASHVIEFLRAATTAEDPSPELFGLTVATLGALSRAGGKESLLLASRFDTRSLRLLGLLPPMDSCVTCGRRWPMDDRSVFLSSASGGIVCKKCREAGGVHGVRLPGKAVQLMHRMADFEDFDSREPAADALWQSFERPVRGVIHELRTNLLERELTLLKSSSCLV